MNCERAPVNPRKHRDPISQQVVSVFEVVISEGPPHFVIAYDKQDVLRTCSDRCFHGTCGNWTKVLFCNPSPACYDDFKRLTKRSKCELKKDTWCMVVKIFPKCTLATLWTPTVANMYWSADPMNVIAIMIAAWVWFWKTFATTITCKQIFQLWKLYFKGICIMVYISTHSKS